MESAETNFKNLSKFIDRIGISEGQFEKDCGLPSGRLQESKGNLTIGEYHLITKRYGVLLNQLGFLCIDRSEVDQENYYTIMDIHDEKNKDMHI